MLDYMMAIIESSLNESAYDEWLEENLDASEEEQKKMKKKFHEDFLNKSSKPPKDQKAHLQYLKRKMHSNKTNGATAQGELPTFNQYGQ